MDLKNCDGCRLAICWQKRSWHLTSWHCCAFLGIYFCLLNSFQFYVAWLGIPFKHFINVTMKKLQILMIYYSKSFLKWFWKPKTVQEGFCMRNSLLTFLPKQGIRLCVLYSSVSHVSVKGSSGIWWTDLHLIYVNVLISCLLALFPVIFVQV